MIAKFHESFFKVHFENEQVRIWRFRPFEDFSMRITRGGNYLYEKFVDITEIDEIFDVGFSVLWNGEWCGFEYSEELNKMEVYSNNPDFAKKHDMETIDRLTYSKIIPADSVSSIRIVFKDIAGKTTRFETISLKELPCLWKQFKTDLLPH